MCNVRTEHVNILRNTPEVKGKFLSQLFPREFMENIPYENVKVGCCIQCGKRMSREEMEPSNRQTPRAMCPECYDYWTSNINDVCPICGEYLPNNKINSQRRNMKEVSHRIHDGRCLDYFSIISCKALGDDMSFLADEKEWYKNPYQEPFQIGSGSHTERESGEYSMKEIIRKALYEYKQNHYLDSLPGQMSLPSPTEKINPRDHFDRGNQRKIFKGKDVIFVPKNRR